MWKELSVPGRQGTKPLLLELGQSSFTWKPHLSSGFGELSCVLTKPAERRTVSGGWQDAGCHETHRHPLYLGFLVHSIPPTDALNILVCPKK